MAEIIERIKNKLPHVSLLLYALAFLLLCICVVLALVLGKVRQQPAPSAADSPPVQPSEAASASPSPEPPQPALLVTAEQAKQLSYTDSVLGELTWDLSEEELLELNQTLVRYNIISDEEICHFLAQATVETGAGRALTESGDEEYFRKRGYSTGTRGAGYLHLTHKYGQMAFATWMMKRYVSGLSDIRYVNPANYGEDEIRDVYYAALQTAANLGLNVSRYSRIVYDPNSTLTTGADYIADQFAWESAGYYWSITGIGQALVSDGNGSTDAASSLIGGTNWQSRREAYAAFYPVLTSTEQPYPSQ